MQMAPTDPGTIDESTGTLPERRRIAGLVALAVSAAATVTWFVWRLGHLGFHPVELVVFAIEVVGLIAGVGIGVALAASRDRRTVYAHDLDDPRRFALAVSDLVGRTRRVDLHRDVRDAVRAAPRWRPRNSSDVAIAALLAEGPRRLALVLALMVGLLLGVAPFPMPPVGAAVSAAVGIGAMSAAHVLLSGGRVRVGDRTRWANSSIGEVLASSDPDDSAPRRWVGTVGVVAVTNLAIALRGMSDRWTHGLRAMADDDRAAAMLLATAVMISALYTLRTTASPELANAHLVARRLEERTARQSVLGAAVCVGLIGLVAGLLPGGVDAADSEPTRVEQVSDDSNGAGDG